MCYLGHWGPINRTIVFLSFFSFASQMDEIVSPSFFVQFGASGLVFCSSMYLMSMVIDIDIPYSQNCLLNVGNFYLQGNPLENLIKFIIVSFYLSHMIAQILLNCYCGSRLSDESNGITHAIYESQWMERNEKCKLAYRILVVRSMRPMTIFAGGLYELSLQTFVKVVSLSSAINIICIHNSGTSLQICKTAYSTLNVLREIDSSLDWLLYSSETGWMVIMNMHDFHTAEFWSTFLFVLS